MNETIFDKLDFGPLKPLLDNDDITDISYCNGGQIWIRSLTQGSIRVEIPGCTQEFMEKLAFQCSNVMGTTFNNAKPFLDAESSELRLNFVHQSIATNGIACVLRKTPAKIRLQKEKLIKDDYFTNDIHDILIKCVEGHCNIIVCGETGSGKTEFVKYLASHTKENEKVITIEDTLELHLDKIFPHRDIVSMKTNNVASYTDVLVTCMRQNPKWILLSEVRSAEAVTAVRNSISSGHNILSTIHADKASAIPYRLYSLMETDLDVNQFLTTIYRYIQLGVHIKAYYSKKYGKFHREVDEVTEFFVDDNNVCQTHTIYRKLFDKEPILVKPSNHLLEYLSNQNIDISNITSKLDDRPFDELVEEAKDDHDDTNIPKTEASIPVQNNLEINNESNQVNNLNSQNNDYSNNVSLMPPTSPSYNNIENQENKSDIDMNKDNNEIQSEGQGISINNQAQSEGQGISAYNQAQPDGQGISVNNQVQPDGQGISVNNQVQPEGQGISANNQAQSDGQGISVNNQVQSEGLGFSISNQNTNDLFGQNANDLFSQNINNNQVNNGQISNDSNSNTNLNSNNVTETSNLQSNDTNKDKTVQGGFINTVDINDILNGQI